MDYVYDIVLNFMDTYYDFYEWQKEDKIINVKKIPIYKITNKDYLNIKYHDITIELDTIPKQSKIFLVTSGLEVMGLLVDNKGKVIKKSSLIFEESDDILNDKEHIKRINLKYHINKKHHISLMSRRTIEKRDYINACFKSFNKTTDEYFLKYLYYDIYEQELNDIDKIYEELLSLAKKDTSKMYNYLKKINTELKRQ